MARTSKKSPEWRYQYNRVNSLRNYYNRGLGPDDEKIPIDIIRNMDPEELTNIKFLDQLIMLSAGEE